MLATVMKLLRSIPVFYEIMCQSAEKLGHSGLVSLLQAHLHLNASTALAVNTVATIQVDPLSPLLRMGSYR
jgi:hypothetical protein